MVPTTNHTYQIIYKSNPEVFDSITNIEICDHFIKSINFLEDTMSIQAAPNFEAQNDSNNTMNIFEDPKTGIYFQYPSDWEIASKEYTQSYFGIPTEDSLFGAFSENLGGPIVLIFPKSFNGASLSILYELLPFPMSVEKLVETTRNYLLDEITALSIAIPVSIGNLNGYKYNITYSDDSFTQTQIVFIKESKGFTITYNLGDTEQSKHIDDINLMINSFKMK